MPRPLQVASGRAASPTGSVLDLGPKYATDKRQADRQTSVCLFVLLVFYEIYVIKGVARGNFKTWQTLPSPALPSPALLCPPIPLPSP